MTVAIAYLFYHVQMLCFFEHLFNRSISFGMKVRASLIGYAIFMLVSYLKCYTVINWIIILVIYVIEFIWLYHLPGKVSVCCGLQGAIFGLGSILIVRSGMTLLLNQPLNSFGEDLTGAKVEDYKYLAILLGFVICGIFFSLLRHIYHDWVFTLSGKKYTFLNFILIMSSLFFLYLDLNLFLYFLEGEETVLKLWEMKSGVCVLAGNLICIHHVYSLAKCMQYEHKKREALQELTEKQRVGKELEKVAQYDMLTGVHNRNAAIERLEQLYREKKDFYLVFADANNLKEVNDKAGHETGDNYLIAISFELRMTFEQYGMVCRYGGDEFLIVTDKFTDEELKRQIEEVKKNIKSYSNTSECPFVLSISCGIANSRECSTWEELVELADKRMYDNKKAEKAWREK